MLKHDQLYRYLFADVAIRGELVTINDTYRAILNNHDYPEPVQQLLGEMLVATSLLTATLKLEGEITLQLQGDGPLSFAVINGNNCQQLRGLARVNSPINQASSFRQMVGQGYLVITITPNEGERYQGIVALEGQTLSECLENYFIQSEQLATRLFIRTAQYQGKPMVGGILLQVLPSDEQQHEAFEHLTQLTQTITANELFNLPVEQCLHRLYHQESVTLFEPQAVSFYCTCSKARCEKTLAALPEHELASLLDQEDHITMHCDFCGKDYRFDNIDIKALQQMPTLSDDHVKTVH